jgi:hypothetical protein
LEDLGLDAFAGQQSGQVLGQGEFVAGRVGGVEAQHVLQTGDGLGAGSFKV